MEKTTNQFRGCTLTEVLSFFSIIDVESFKTHFSVAVIFIFQNLLFQKPLHKIHIIQEQDPHGSFPGGLNWSQQGGNGHVQLFPYFPQNQSSSSLSIIFLWLSETKKKKGKSKLSNWENKLHKQCVEELQSKN